MRIEPRRRGRTLWIVNQPSTTPRDGTSNRHFNLARQLGSAGWDVRIIGTAPASSVARRGRPTVESVDGVQFTLLQSPPYRGSTVSRLASWGDFYLRAIDPRTTRHLPPPAVVMGCVMTPLGALAGWKLAKRHAAQFVYEVRDLWPRTPIAFGQFSAGSVPARVLTRLDRRMARDASLLVSPLPLAYEYYQAEYDIPRSRFAWIPNAVDLDRRFAEPVPCHPSREVRLQYLGSLGRANDIDLIIEGVIAARRAGVPVRLRLVGEGDYLPQARRIVARESARSFVEFHGSVPQEQVSVEMQWGNALILAIRDRRNLYRYGVSPNKLVDYLASGQWVVVAADVPANPASGAPGTTIITPDVPAMVAGLRDLASVPPDQRITEAAGNRAVVEREFDSRVQGDRLGLRLEAIMTDGAFGA